MDIQNELLKIIADLIIERVTSEVRNSGQISIIIIAMCLRSVHDGMTMEPFVGFYSIPSTEGKVL